MSTAANKPHVVTRRIGGLAAIQDPEVRSVIWIRSLTQAIRTELADLLDSRFSELEFVAVPTDPHDRIRHQFGQYAKDMRFLTSDIALLVTVFGEISNAQRVRVRLKSDASENFGESTDVRLRCTYPGSRPFIADRRQASAHVAVFRDHFKDERLDSRSSRAISLSLEKVHDTRGVQAKTGRF